MRGFRHKGAVLRYVNDVFPINLAKHFKVAVDTCNKRIHA